MSSLSPVEILHEAFQSTRAYQGTYAYVPKILRNAQLYLRGELIVSGLYSGLFFTGGSLRDPQPLHHTCMDYPEWECPACMAWSDFGKFTRTSATE